MIPIVFCIDDNIEHCQPAINSIKHFNHTDCIFHILENIDIPIGDWKRPCVQSKAQYWRWLIPEKFPEYDKIIYLDCDVILNSDIAELYNIDLEGSFIAATKDKAIQTIGETIRFQGGHDIPEKYKLMPSYNSGQLLINAKKWREDDISSKLINFANEYKCNDMLAMNCVFNGKIKELEKGWCTPINYLDDNLESIHEMWPSVDYDMKLLHWHGHGKPWNEDYNHWSKEIYQRYEN
jgi:lipopolysaccharide biosynthesis glycosyltransferase